jgi:hypothetical protein
MNKNAFVINPKTNEFVFGKIPAIKLPRGDFPAGEIVLRYGEHIRTNRGFGVAHI